MSALTRLGCKVARSSPLFQHQSIRFAAAAASPSDPVQKLFLDKVREFKQGNLGLDEAHKKQMNEELERLRRVYHIDESSVTQIDQKFEPEVDIKLHDLDDPAEKELRQKIDSGSLNSQVVKVEKDDREIWPTIPEQKPYDEFHFPEANKPSWVEVKAYLESDKPKDMWQHDVYNAFKEYKSILETQEPKPDYEYVGEPMTPKRLERTLLLRFGDDMPTIHDDKKPERDAKNFPRLYRNDEIPPTRMSIIPESWFKIFHAKTGITGPYVFGAGLTTFLFSKEIIPVEHQFMEGAWIFFYMMMVRAAYHAFCKFKPDHIWAQRLNPKAILQRHKDAEQVWFDWQSWHIKLLDDVNKYYTDQKLENPLKPIHEIRKQDVELQVEAEYRQRVKTIYDNTKRRLDYLVALADSQRQISQKNMVNWVISNAMSSIGAKQEAEVLDNCIADLKALSKKNANVL